MSNQAQKKDLTIILQNVRDIKSNETFELIKEKNTMMNEKSNLLIVDVSYYCLHK